MRASTEEFLWTLLWTAGKLARPTWRNLHEDFESWSWRNGLARRIAALERQQMLERVPDELAHAVVRLTNAGRLAALGGRDPNAQWARGWDGQWRMVVFDVPVTHDALRLRLWRNLRRQGFGFLQNSVWITPDPIDRSRLAAASSVPSVEMIIVLNARHCGGETDAAIVQGAWNFDAINEEYQRYLNFVDQCAPDGDGFQPLRCRAK